MASVVKNEEARLALLLDQLESCKDVKDGRASFAGPGYQTLRVLISRLLNVDSSIPEEDKSRLVSSSVFSAAASGRLSRERLIGELSRGEEGYLRKPFVAYRMIAQISLARTQCPSRFDFDGTRISFAISKDHKLFRHHKMVTDHIDRLEVPKLPNNYVPCSISCRARTEFHAFEMAGRALDFWRGSFNLGLNQGRSWRISVDRRSPVNSILSHPIYTIHQPDGKLASDSWYYNSDYQIEKPLFNDVKESKVAADFAVFFRKKLANHPYRREVIDAIVRYGSALDTVSYETAFLQLWSVCEGLTRTTTTESKITIKRVKALYRDENFADVVLQVLKEYRNRAVHVGEQTIDMEALLYHIKNITEDLILFHAFNRFKLQSLDQTVNLLDLGTSMTVLSNKQTMLRKAIERAELR